MNSIVEASNLKKYYRKTHALDGVSLRLEPGHILGLIGPNGAGKTTLLRSLTGLLRVDGELDVLGHDPWRNRVKVMRDVAFIADTATLPSWARVDQLFTYLEKLHPNFSRAQAETFLARTSVDPKRRIKTLSKGMVVQAHLAMIMAIDAKLLILDEPTLGLDLLFRKTFYTNLLNEYFDGERTIVISTHQVEEIEHILTDVIFLDRGKVVLDTNTESLGDHYASVTVKPEALERARALRPLQEQTLMGHSVFLYEDTPAEKLKQLGEVRRPGLADIFVAKMQENRS
ncbi:MAG: ABC transporter ATP-binding protein [Gammaproteobacteria bacterium]|nr:ABC transporter ATP-binding protein [Gammaproteobacteria bacterium]